MHEGERIYAFGYSPAAVGMMESRSAGANAAFFLPHLAPGMHLLDIGCGPGSITVGLASAVSPGEVVGIDIEPSQVELASKRAASEGLGNCRFETASVHDLPLPDNSIDAVFGHTILLQFRDLDPVLAEVKRVLKPAGLVGFREIDLGANLYHSETSAIRQVFETLRRSIRHNDGNPDIGRSLPALLTDAGFELVSANATYVCTTTPAAKAGMYNGMKRLWQQADFARQAEILAWIDAAERAAVIDRLEAEAEDPRSFSGTSYVEVVARAAGP